MSSFELALTAAAMHDISLGPLGKILTRSFPHQLNPHQPPIDLDRSLFWLFP